MYTYEHCFITFEEGRKADDITMYSLSCDFYKHDIVADRNYIYSVNNTLKVNAKLHPPKDASVFIGYKLPINIDNIRRNYSIRKKKDSADYIIMPDSIRDDSNIYINKLWYFPNNRICIASRSYNRQACEDEYKTILSSINLSQPEQPVEYTNKQLIGFADTKDVLLEMFRGQNLDRYVPCSSLDYSSGNSIPLDVIELTYRLGSSNSTDDIARYRLQLMALNSYDWRNCKGTISLVFSMLMGRNTTHRYISAHRSGNNKDVNNIISTCRYADYVSGDDMELGRSFVRKVLNLNEKTVFVDTDKLFSKLNERYIAFHEFVKLFNTVTRITDSTYEEKDKSEVS